MRCSLLFFFLSPGAAAVLSARLAPGVLSGGEPKTGPLCCNEGTADPSGTCKAMGLNAYAGSSCSPI
ncbi:hypothetical protein LY78DRAFT_660670 [Colletotrichum sublineola]|nr:hypothetical protein LY78DRAFT_660670 [Colletotrichum sublineola]